MQYVSDSWVTVACTLSRFKTESFMCDSFWRLDKEQDGQQTFFGVVPQGLYTNRRRDWTVK